MVSAGSCGFKSQRGYSVCDINSQSFSILICTREIMIPPWQACLAGYLPQLCTASEWMESLGHVLPDTASQGSPPLGDQWYKLGQKGVPEGSRASENQNCLTGLWAPSGSLAPCVTGHRKLQWVGRWMGSFGFLRIRIQETTAAILWLLIMCQAPTKCFYSFSYFILLARWKLPPHFTEDETWPHRAPRPGAQLCPSPPATIPHLHFLPHHPDLLHAAVSTEVTLTSSAYDFLQCLPQILGKSPKSQTWYAGVLHGKPGSPNPSSFTHIP